MGKDEYQICHFSDGAMHYVSTRLVIPRCCTTNIRLRLLSTKESSSSAAAARASVPKFVSIRASDVAAVIGRNQFKPASEVALELWQRYSPSTFTGTTKIDSQLESFARASRHEQNIVLQSASYQAQDAKEAIEQLKAATSIIQTSTSLSETDKEHVMDLLTREVNTSHGIRTEDIIVDHVAKRDGTRFVRDNNIYSFPVCVIDGTKYVVRGKIDRIQQDDEDEVTVSAESEAKTEAEAGTVTKLILVEVKTRMKRLFHEVREYERIQILTYLRMLPLTVHKAKLIEQYQEEVNIMYIERDEEEWNNHIQPMLVAFCVDLHKSMCAAGGAGDTAPGANTPVVLQEHTHR